MELREIKEWFEANRNVKNTEGMARFGINSADAYGLPMPMLRAKAREIKKDHALALRLWDDGTHEARLLACLVADPKQMTPELMDQWTAGFDSWDVCDQCCINLFRKTPYAHAKIREYAPDEREFVRRTAFVLIATLVVHDKAATDADFTAYLNLIEEYASDNRNFVKKAVNWALRQIGKRNFALNAAAVEVSQRLAERKDDPAARWTGRDALRELTSQKTLDYIRDHRSN